VQRLDVVPDYVFTIDGFLTPDECAQFIRLGEDAGFDDAPITTAAGPMMRPDIRNNSRVVFDEVSLANDLWRRLAPHVPPTIEGTTPVGLNERFRFYRYDPGQIFAPHYDGAYRRDNGECSQLTFMAYLNEGFGGGETKFDLRHGEITIVPKTGMALLFIHRLLHEGARVTSGRKYVLRSDVMYTAPARLG
jgi:predicted 2-oxoglutarate/Fe(II)-dependent dioxygenase YbiX